MPKILILETSNSLEHLIPSGSYWFRLEMAYGWNTLGWTPRLVQHPCLQGFPWAEFITWPLPDADDLTDFDLILLLGDFPGPSDPHYDCLAVYWDIEGLPYRQNYFKELLRDPHWGNVPSCGSRNTTLREELETAYFHLKKQHLRYWNPDFTYSIASKPLLREATHLPMGAESDLYEFRESMARDIRLAIVGQTDHWFGGQERIPLANDILRSLHYPVSHWYGTIPNGQQSLPLNCFPMGIVDFLSIRYLLQRIRYLLHVPRPYHLVSRSLSATLFQGLAAGAIPLHVFDSETAPGYAVNTISNLDDLEVPPFLPEYTYQHRFRRILEDMF